MPDDHVERRYIGEVEGYVCERCTHRTMARLDDARRWEPVEIEGQPHAAREVPEPLDPPAAPTLFRCKSCGWETTKPRRDTGPWADDPAGG